MIMYLYTEGQKACEVEPLKVGIDGRIVGEIRKVEGGYQYFPKGKKEGGEIFSTVNEVQCSLDEALTADFSISTNSGQIVVNSADGKARNLSTKETLSALLTLQDLANKEMSVFVHELSEVKNEIRRLRNDVNRPTDSEQWPELFEQKGARPEKELIWVESELDVNGKKFGTTGENGSCFGCVFYGINSDTECHDANESQDLGCFENDIIYKVVDINREESAAMSGEKEEDEHYKHMFDARFRELLGDGDLCAEVEAGKPTHELITDTYRKGEYGCNACCFLSYGNCLARYELPLGVECVGSEVNFKVVEFKRDAS